MVESFLEQVKSPAVFCHVLPCAEIENLVGLDVIASLKWAGKQSETLSVLKQIRSDERRLGLDERESFHLFFDLKKGFTDQDIRDESVEEGRQWLASRVRMGGLDPQSFTLGGFGRRLLRQLQSSPTFSEAVRLSFSSPEWRHAFRDLLAEAGWVFLAPLSRRT